jgi:transcriptional regulator with XRE-family HTH domain
MSQRELARAINIGETTLSQILSGKQNPMYGNVLAIMMTLKANPGWIVCGIEPKYLDDANTPDSQQYLKPVHVTGVERWILETHENMAQPEKAFLRNVPFPFPEVQQPAVVYQMVLTAYRQAVQFGNEHAK